MTAHHEPQPGQQLGLADIVQLLGHKQWTSLMQKEVGATGVRNHHVTPGIVPALIAALAPGDVWYGIQEITTPPGGNKRATAKTVGTLCGIYADLDIKTGGCPTEEHANHIINDLSNIYGERPTYIVFSGHGLQPVWTINHNDPARQLTNPQTRQRAATLLNRHGRLVQTIALQHQSKADSVFDLPRVLRAPDTTNHKNPADPKPTAAVRDTGQPLTIDHIENALTAAGIPELESDQTIQAKVVAAPSTWRHRNTTQQQCRYADDMIAGWATDDPAARHPWLVAQATRISAARRYGCLSTADAAAAERELDNRFITLCRRAGDARPVGHTEVAAAIRYGQDLTATKTDHQLATELGNHKHRDHNAEALELARMAEDLNNINPAPVAAAAPAPTTTRTAAATVGTLLPPLETAEEPHAPAAAPVPTNPSPAPGNTVNDYIHQLEEIEQDFWTARPSLQLIHNAALTETAAPWAVLATILMRVIAAVPHDVHLPGLGGSHSSPGTLNLYAGIVSKPSGGKGTAAKAAARLYTHENIFEAGAGSGEGIGHLYGSTHQDKETKTTEFKWARRSVLLDIAEVDTLTAMTRRDSSTIDSVLRQAFSGESIMFSYATVEKRLRLPAGEYRLSGVVHIQPQRASGLFAGADGGTPQRFIWAAASDPRIGTPVTYNGDTLSPHKNGTTYRPEWWSNGHIIDVCQTALDDIHAERLRRAQDWSFTDDPDNPDQALGGHTMYAREKVAAALAILDGRENINPEDWRLSGTVINMSNHVRDRLIDAMEIGRLTAAEKRGMEKGAEKIGARTAETDIDEERFTATRKRIIGILATDGETTSRNLRSKMSKTQRPWFLKSLESLEQDGILVRIETGIPTQGGRPGITYRLTE